MTDTIFPFGSIDRCRKCDMAADSADIRYCQAADHARDEAGQVIDLSGSGFGTEHLHLRCARCGFEWLEATADTGPPDG